MTGKDYVLAALLGGAYVLLFSYLIGYTVTWGDPASWYDFWGRSNASAVSWMQIFHSIGVVLAALPIAVLLAWRYQSNWLRPSLIVAIIGSSFMLFDQIRGAWLLSDLDIQPETYLLVSGVIDIVKVGAILVIVTACVRWVTAFKKGSELRLPE